MDLFVDWFLHNSVYVLRDIDLDVLDLLDWNLLDLFNLDYFLYIFGNCDGLLNLLDLRNFDYLFNRNLHPFLYIPIDGHLHIHDPINDPFDHNIDWDIDDSVDYFLNSFFYYNIFIVGNLFFDLLGSDLSSPWLDNCPSNLLIDHNWDLDLFLHLIDNLLVYDILDVFLNYVLNNDRLFDNLLDFLFDNVLHRGLYHPLNRIVHYPLNDDILLDVSLDWLFDQNFVGFINVDLFYDRLFYDNIILFLNYILVDNRVHLVDLNRVFDLLVICDILGRPVAGYILLRLSTAIDYVNI